MAKKTLKAKSAKRAGARAAARMPVKKAAAKSAQRSVKQSTKKPAKTAAKAPSATRVAGGGSGLLSVAPGFTANDAAASIKWYCDVLGFTVKERWEHEGQFRGAQIASGAVTINIGQDDWKLGRDRVKGQGTRIYIMMGPGIDEYAAAIKARGGRLDHEPLEDWGLRAFSITDPDGFKLTFMTPAKR
jgi:catechol 2,3-dioxygenase-like lactoylglutathione lyase family enzyme